MGITEELRYTAAKLLNAGKSTVGSAVSQGVCVAVGLQVKGKLKKNVVMVEEMMQMQAKAEKVEEEICSLRSRRGDEEENLKRLFDEPLNNTTPQNQIQTKIFIRSRL